MSRSRRHCRSWSWRSLAAYGLLLLGQSIGLSADPTEAVDPREAARNARAWESIRLREAGRAPEAVEAAEATLASQRELTGPDEDLAGALEFTAGAHTAVAEFEKAQAYLREALAVRRRAFGEGHWRTVDSRYALERVGRLTELDAEHRGRYREAARLDVEAGKLGTRTYEIPPMVAARRKAATAMAEAVGESHPEFAGSLEKMAWAARMQAAAVRRNPTYREATEAYVRALEIRRQALGDAHPDVAKSLEALAVHPAEGDGPEVAVGLFRRALTCRLDSQGERHPDVARTLVRLADAIDLAGGDRREAVGLIDRTLEILTRTTSESDPTAIRALQVMGKLASALGDEALEERSIVRRVDLERRRIASGEVYGTAGGWFERLGPPPDPGAHRTARLWVEFVTREVLATSLGELGRFHGRRGNLGRAGQFMRESMDVFAENLDRQAAVSMGRAYFDPYKATSFGLALDRYLSLSLEPAAEITPDEAYRQLLAWKGGFFSYELRSRRWLGRPELATLVGDLSRASDELAREALAAPDARDRAGWARVMELQGRRDRLEGQLAEAVARFAARERRERPDVERLKAALPAGVALVDFKVYGTWIGWNKASAVGPVALMAFVVRADGPVERLELGPWPALSEAIKAWRKHGLPPEEPSEAAIPEPTRRSMAQAALATIERQLWRPLRARLDGVRTLLIAPDSALATFPFAVLSGSEPGSHLIEEAAVAVVPVPQQLALADDRPRAEASDRLIAVGDVDFDADPGVILAAKGAQSRSPRRAELVPRGRLMQFGRLPATHQEVDIVSRIFLEAFPGGETIRLERAEATESRFRKTLGGARFLHLATHGFFEPPELGPWKVGNVDPSSYWSSPQGLVRLSPGLLSGITFAGANRPPSPEREDGILTAVEAQQLDLSGVDLAVLSACQTGLGSEAKGEGLMGLQRAFQVGGARSLVSSLWPVDDAATLVLMREFYTNLWRKGLPKLEALRQAQLEILRHYDPDRQDLGDSKGPRRRNPPYFWAPFTLSGAWQ